MKRCTTLGLVGTAVAWDRQPHTTPTPQGDAAPRGKIEKPRQIPGFSRTSLAVSAKRATGIEPVTFSLGTPGLPVGIPVDLAASDAPRVRLHTGLHKPAHDRDSRPRARPATIAHGRSGPALAPIPGRRQSVRRRANVAGRGRLHVYAYRIRDVAAVGGVSVDVDARLPRRRYLAGDGRMRCLREQPRGETEFVSRVDGRVPGESARFPTWGRTCPHVAE